MTERPVGEPAKIFALERYHNWANVMRQHFEAQTYEDERRAHWEPYMACWYSLLYVVVEGWKELGLSDPEINELLLDDEKKELLRRYRNGAFHYQAESFDDRFVNLWSRDFEATYWIRCLHDAFGHWFPAWNESYGRWLDSKRPGERQSEGQSG
jgi:hypothetical protein